MRSIIVENSREMLNTILHGDCLELMAGIPDKSVDMVLCDLPYGTTACEWDEIIPFAELWEQYKRIIKDNGAIVLTASQPFASKLVVSNLKMFKYEWVWEKEQGVNFQLAKKQPLKKHESILVFSKTTTIYNPHGLKQHNENKFNKGKGGKLGHLSSENKRSNYVQLWTNYPNTLIFFKRQTGLHPTQKPVALFEYLIKTYTNPGDTVLDNCIGSGTTAIACMNTGRNFIGMEKELKYFEIATERVYNHARTCGYKIDAQPSNLQSGKSEYVQLGLFDAKH